MTDSYMKPASLAYMICDLSMSELVISTPVLLIPSTDMRRDRFHLFWGRFELPGNVLVVNNVSDSEMSLALIGNASGHSFGAEQNLDPRRFR
jgi:hypothetical protein